MSNPKVSILMPIYKPKYEYLLESIQSILNQTFTNFELLILDDCPEDDREKIVKSFKDERIKYFKNEKTIGVALSKNKLIELSVGGEGDYLAIMNQDGISLPRRLEKQVNFLDNHPQIGVVGSWYTTISSHKTVVYPMQNNEIVKKIINGQNCILHPTSMFRRDVLENIRYEEEYFPMEDLMLFIKLIGSTKFYNIPDFLFQYREEDNIHKDNINDATKNILNFCQKKYPKTRFFPCCFFPLLMIKRRKMKIQVYLMGFLPLLDIKIMGDK